MSGKNIQCCVLQNKGLIPICPCCMSEYDNASSDYDLVNINGGYYILFIRRCNKCGEIAKYFCNTNLDGRRFVTDETYEICKSKTRKSNDEESEWEETAE